MADAVLSLPVLEVTEWGPGIRSLRFPKSFDASPGQFVFLWLPGVDEKPFSISALDEDGLELVLRSVGPFTRALERVRPGDLLGIRGPFGRGFQLRGDALLVGGGMGMAPIRFLARELDRQGRRAPLLLGARTAQEIFCHDELAGLGARFATEDGSLGHKGLVTELLEPLLSQDSPSLCACGPEPMLLALRNVAQRHGLPCQLSFERYMKCGLGICGQCCLDGSGIRLCVEGPVLQGADMDLVTDLGLPHRDATGLRPG